MNARSMSGGPNNPPPTDQSALSLLVSAAEGRDHAARRDTAGNSNSALAETLRFRGQFEAAGAGGGGGGGGPTAGSLEEQLLQLQQQQQAAALFGGNAAAGGGGPSAALLHQLREQGLLSQLGSLGAAGAGNNPGAVGGGSLQNQHLAALLGLGGAAPGASQDVQASNNPGNDIRAALAAQLRQSQQQQQQAPAPPPQLSHADLLALARSGALSSNNATGMAGLLSRLSGGGGGGAAGLSTGFGGGGGGLASELENLQMLEELERRQRLMSTAMGGGAGGGSPSLQAAAGPSTAGAPMDSPALRGLREERLNHIPRPPGQEVGVASSKAKPGLPTEQVSAASKEELEKTPGSVIVPCRARGMPMDHNFKTAYFVIPENVKHGEELICSYFACRNAGIKFRYCSFCKVPVAKRNFRKRHKHGGQDIPRGGDEEEAAPVKKGIPAHIMASQNVDGDADAISSQSADSNPQQKSDIGVRRGLVQWSMRTLEENAKKPEAAEAPADEEPSSKISLDRKERWAALLGKRPATKDGDSMSAWLMEVLAVSDLDTPLKSEDATSTAAMASLAVPMAVDDKGKDVKEPATLIPDKESTVVHLDGDIVKKKRPAPEVAKIEGGELVSGSFAEWKERKKAKKQAKLSSSSQEAES